MQNKLIKNNKILMNKIYNNKLVMNKINRIINNKKIIKLFNINIVHNIQIPIYLIKCLFNN